MNKTILIAVVLAATFVTGCGYKEGVTTEAQNSFLYFSGDIDGVMVSVDGGAPFPVEPGRDNLYSIPPGNHRVLVTRDGDIVVKRDIFVGNGVAKEIEVR